MQEKQKTLRLILGDQLNINHSWFSKAEDEVLYALMEVKSESEYVTHHIQKIVGFFAAMRNFANTLNSLGHKVVYYRIDDPQNLQRIDLNLQKLIQEYNCSRFEYQLPDEYRLDILLKEFCKNIKIPSCYYDTEHFYTTRNELTNLFKNRKTFLMETFYRQMRIKHNVLMKGGKPLNDRWNFDDFNRSKLPKNHVLPEPLQFSNNVRAIYNQVKKSEIESIGEINPEEFIWPVSREQSLQLLEYFLHHGLPLFGTYQDAMQNEEWSLYHSRLSFSLNTKMISPKEVVDAAIQHYQKNQDKIQYHQLEGFVRQIIGWREYMRGVYWNQMPGYAQKNFFNHTSVLPNWYWTAQTKMNCLHQCIKQSLNKAYAHHIQRLMVTGNFALLAGVHPNEVDGWYLGIYIDAIEWVEITNTRGMSQYADGGLLATKPYVGSASYINKMSNYCTTCYYKKELKSGDRACPFNSLYWHFIFRNEDKLKSNQRMSMMYAVWNKMNKVEQEKIIMQAEDYLKRINDL